MATRFPDRSVGRSGFVASVRDALVPAGAFLAQFAKNPLKVGSPFASSRRMVDRLLEPVEWSKIGVLVEYGPGTGRFTEGALARMRRGSTLVAIDACPGFTAHLEAAIDDPRLRAVSGSAADAPRIVARAGLGEADCIISGLPFSTLPDGEAETIVAASARLLRPGGLFLAYQVRDHIRPLLEARFNRLGEAYEWRNLPPCHLYWYRKVG